MALVREPRAQHERSSHLRWLGETALWLALLVALSPTLHDLMGHWLLHSWSRYSLGFVPLLILAIRADSPGRPLRGPALALIAVCLVGQILASLASVIYVARPLAGAAVAGLLLYLGRGRPRSALLALCLIPVPSMLMNRWLGGAELARSAAEAAASLVSTLGVSVQAVGPILTAGDLQLRVEPQWGGVLLALQGLGLAWYYSVARNLSVRATATALVAAAILAFPVQLAVLVLSALALGAGQPTLAAALIDPGSWLAPLCAALYLGEVRATV